MTANRLPGEGYRPALDGMRAVSVVTIMLFHASFEWVRGGYWSVNVFFCVSGYLITSLLLKEYDKWGNIDLVGFYVRRARRLLPALLVVLVVVSFLTPRIMGSMTPGTVRGDGWSALFYVANWRMILTGQSYFEAFGAQSPFRHMWTLAIEEQFYLFFPLLLILLMRLFGRRSLKTMWVMVGLAVLSAIAMSMAYTGGDPSRVYYGTDSRLQDIMMGCALACLFSWMGPRRIRSLAKHRTALVAAGWVLAVGCFTSFFLFPAAGIAFDGGFFLFDLSFAALIACVELVPDSKLAQIFSLKPFTWVGQLSYGLYLWHWPIFVWMDPERMDMPRWAVHVLAFGLTFVLASVSFYWIENPVRKGTLRKKIGGAWMKAVTAAAVAGTAAVIAVSTIGQTLAPTAASGQSVSTTVGDGDFPLLIVGDSVGFALGYNFPAAEYPNVQATAEVKFGCGTAEQRLAFDGRPQKGGDQQQDCEDQFSAWTTAAQNTKPKAVMWSVGGWEVFDHVGPQGEILEVGTPEYATYLLGRLEQGRKALADGGAETIVLTKVPCYYQPSFVVNGDDLAPDRNDPKRAQAVNSILEDFAKKHTGSVHLVDPGEWLCPGGKYQEKIDGKKMRKDGVHYTEDGVAAFWKRHLPQLQKWGA